MENVEKDIALYLYESKYLTSDNMTVDEFIRKDYRSQKYKSNGESYADKNYLDIMSGRQFSNYMNILKQPRTETKYEYDSTSFIQHFILVRFDTMLAPFISLETTHNDNKDIGIPVKISELLYPFFQACILLNSSLRKEKIESNTFKKDFDKLIKKFDGNIKRFKNDYDAYYKNQKCETAVKPELLKLIVERNRAIFLAEPLIDLLEYYGHIYNPDRFSPEYDYFSLNWKIISTISFKSPASEEFLWNFIKMYITNADNLTYGKLSAAKFIEFERQYNLESTSSIFDAIASIYNDLVQKENRIISTYENYTAPQLEEIILV